MLTSWSEVATPAELSIASVLMRPPLSAYSIRPRCVKPRLPPSPTTLQRRSRSVHPHRIVGAIADLGVRFRGGFHIGADAAVVEQIDRRLEDRADQLVRRELIGFDPQHALASRGDRNRFRRARPHAAAFRDQLGVVIGPRRTRKLEQTRALVEAARRIGVGIDENMAMIERRDELDVFREQHAVAEHVARHVADARNGEVGRLRVDAHLAEVALHRFPRAARGDAHLLVVVSRRPAGGEGIAEPEAVFLRDRIGVIGEGGGSLVRRDHEIRIVGIVAPHLRRRHHLARRRGCR